MTFSNNSLGASRTVNGGTAGIVLGTTIGNNNVIVQGLVTLNVNGNAVVQSTAPGTTINITSAGNSWWIGSATAADAKSNISSGVTVSNNGSETDTVKYYNNLTGAGNFTYTSYSASTGYILGTTSLTGVITANRSISFGNGGQAARSSGGPTPVTDNAGVTFNSTTNTAFSGVLSGGGAVSQSGTNTLIFSGSSNYTGDTINSGTLQLGGGGATGWINHTSGVDGQRRFGLRSRR